MMCMLDTGDISRNLISDCDENSKLLISEYLSLKLSSAETKWLLCVIEDEKLFGSNSFVGLVKDVDVEDFLLVFEFDFWLNLKNCYNKFNWKNCITFF